MNVLNTQLFEHLNKNQVVGNRQPVKYGASGMSPEQLDAIETQLGFAMPSDFRLLLQSIQDSDGVFFEWTDFRLEKYRSSIERIQSGIDFDIEHNAVWLARWGKRPEKLSEAQAVAREDFQKWPKLFPVSAHRYIAAEPCTSGNPVFSIWQTDIIYYGSNLADYLLCEFAGKRSPDVESFERRVPIWSDFAEQTQGFSSLG